jgi:DNA-binding NtrC family response regulator
VGPLPSSNDRSGVPPGEGSVPRSGVAGTLPAQRSLAFEGNGPDRGERALVDSLTTLLALRPQSDGFDAALQMSFGRGFAGLGAEKGILAMVRQESPLEIEISCSTGLSAEDEQAFRLLPAAPDAAGRVIRRTIETGEPVLSGNPDQKALDLAISYPGRPPSVLCAPVRDSLTGGTLAVVYFQNDGKRMFRPRDSEWLTAYAAALGQVLTLQQSGQRSTSEIEAEWRQVGDPDGPRIVGDSEATRQLAELLNSLLPSTTRTDAPAILVTGESGTGKELVARYLHHHSPKRKRGPFQAFNCAGLRGELVESKLFGHVKGAFTGAISDAPGLFRAANNGVLLLDEVGELPPEGQAILLRVLETRTVQPVGDSRCFPVDVQIILATNRRVEDEVAAKRFREDLYYRVTGLQVELLPLRHPRRIADIRPLLGHYLARHERALKKKTLGLTRDALRALLQFSWPGNVRQLSNVCSSLVTHALPGAWLDVADIGRLRPDVLSGSKNPHPEAYLEEGTYSEALRAFRAKLVFDRLRQHGNNAFEAAASLRISGPTFYRYWMDAKRFP